MANDRRVTEEQIRAIWEAHDLGPVRRVSSTASGVSNECYVVDDALVVRFNTMDPQWLKFRSERIAYDLLARSGLPVPTVVVLDESRQIVPYDYMVATRLPGVNVYESRGRLDGKQARALAWRAGECLGHIHGHTFDGFGKLRALDDAPFASWGDYYHDYVDRYVRPARAQGLVDEATVSRLYAVLDRTCDLFAPLGRGVLVHCDLQYENILQENGKLTGLLDFEWALSGDPSFDFCVGEEREEMLPGSEAFFVEGYLSVRAFDRHHEKKVEAYRLFLALETTVTDARMGDAQGVREALEELAARLERCL